MEATMKATALLLAWTILAAGAASAQQTEKAAVDAKLSEIGDLTIVPDTDTLVADAQKQITEISKDVDAKKRGEEFKTIRSLRLRLNKRSPELRGLLESFRQH